jgi:hypothetical protein
MNSKADENQSRNTNDATTSEPQERTPLFSMGFWILAIITVVEIGVLCAFTDFPLKVMSVSPQPIRSLLGKVITVPPDIQLDNIPVAKKVANTRPRTRMEIMSELSRTTPSGDVCRQLAQLAHEDGIGTSRQHSDPGTAFVRQIVMCVHTKHWPPAMASDPVVKWAISEMRELQKAGII